MSESESIKYLDKTGLGYFWDKIKTAFVKKEAGKGLSSNDFTAAEKTKLSGLPAAASILTTSDKGAENGVCPLDGSGKVLGTYLPTMDAEIYVVSVQTDSEFLNPTANASELAAIHTKYDDGVLCYLKIRAQGKYNDYYVPMYSHFISDTECEFRIIVNGEYVYYTVLDNTIMADKAPLMPGMTDHIVERGTSGGWTYEKWDSGTVKGHITSDITIETWDTSGNIFCKDLSIGLPAFIAANTPVNTIAQLEERLNEQGASSGLFSAWIGGCVSRSFGASDPNNGIRARVFASTSDVSKRFRVTFYITGKWKT